MWLFSACILLLKYKPHLWRKICSSWLLGYKIHCCSPLLTHNPSLCYLKEPSSDLWLLSIFWGRESYVLIIGYISWVTCVLLKPPQIVLQKTCYQERPVAKSRVPGWSPSKDTGYKSHTPLSSFIHICITHMHSELCDVKRNICAKHLKQCLSIVY